VHLSIRTIHKLSGALNLPHAGLLRLSGATVKLLENFSQTLYDLGLGKDDRKGAGDSDGVSEMLTFSRLLQTILQSR
jgi:hypothetical protein